MPGTWLLYYHLFFQSPSDGYLGYFQFFPSKRGAAVTLLVHTHDVSNILIFSFSELIQLSVATTLAHAIIILPLDDCLSLLTEFPLVPPIYSPPRDPIKTQASVAYSSAQNPPMAPISCQLKYTKTFMASQSGPTTSPASSISCSLHPLCFSYTGLLPPSLLPLPLLCFIFLIYFLSPLDIRC